MTPAAFRADFSTFKNVPSRKCVQLVFEIPTEAFADALEKLGGAPNPGASVSVAIARLDVSKVEKPKKRTASQRAWALCQSARFQVWLCGMPDATHETTVTALRRKLGIVSRSELDTDREARARFETLEREYQESTR